MERWNNRFLLILAVAGGATGIGNFLRFPTLFAQYGGMFLIPYLCSFFILGLPLMFIEWILGAMARDCGKNSLSLFLEVCFKNRFVKYLGVACVSACLIISGYYMYIESWILGYGWISITGGFKNMASSDMGDFLGQYITIGDGVCDVIVIVALIITVFLNYYFTARGISKGIASLIKFSMPLLMIIALIMLVKVLFFTPGSWEGIKYMFSPRVGLSESKMWIDAASQMFYSLSVGFTSTFTYVTYADKNLDISKQGLMASYMNVGMEVLIASFIAIPVSYVAFGADKIQDVVNSSSIAFGMVSMPAIFNNIPGGSFWNFLWFFLLFIAALTSSLSIVQPSASFFCNKFNISKFKGTVCSLLVCLLIIIPSVVISVGVDEFDFWANSFIIPFGAFFLIWIIYMIGPKKCWAAYEENSTRPLNGFMKFCIQFATPLMLIMVMAMYIYNYGMEI
ncbi:MAG: sodium-dependent transporter, partial [Armatimonadetes bacterium]|nr:sodium-dependent transporter [Candidatus Hippobium faecium]